jgi:hypothetical protein
MFEETKQKIMKGSRKSLIKEGHRRSTIKVIADCAGVNQDTGSAEQPYNSLSRQFLLIFKKLFFD